ncbi:MAG: alpha-L-rhamnosidase, partial [Pirellulaceae bacterium]|nr:alpha-L-rhamnosidase [Pirellulaceae bacterium]
MDKMTRFIFLFMASWALGLTADAVAQSPDGLMVEFLQGSEVVDIGDREPEFGWIVHSRHQDDVQVAYRILVATSPASLEKGEGDTWDTGRVESAESINVSYGGKPLAPRGVYYWSVKTWCRLGGESSWSTPQKFTMASEIDGYRTSRYPLRQIEVAPKRVAVKGPGHYFVDFGKVAFGHVRLNMPRPTMPVEVHLGERGDDQGINRTPGGSVRYYRVVLDVNDWPAEGCKVDVRPPKDERNTSGEAVRLPDEIGVIAPFRYVEIVGSPTKFDASMIRQVAVFYPFDETASRFESSDQILNDVWDLCKYTMKATSFAGVYADGDRERIPYEGDSYIHQLSHYSVDREYSLARYSHEYLLRNPTWPTEWKQHSVLMAWADYMYTGDKESLAEHYDLLKSEKTLEQYARPDGLLNTRGLRDVVDWPAGERDGFDFREVNAVVNAFYYRTLVEMADLAGAIGRDGDAADYRRRADMVRTAFNRVFFDSRRGVYVDGEGSEHASLHANMMPLAFGLVPDEHVDSVADFVVSRGMACSVYGAQYLLEALYHAQRDNVALRRMVSKDVRSWYNMLRVGSTMTLEAWDDRFKPNQDWNHPWGAAPANIVARYVLGVRPLEPGFRKVLIRPQP